MYVSFLAKTQGVLQGFVSAVTTLSEFSTPTANVCANLVVVVEVEVTVSAGNVSHIMTRLVTDHGQLLSGTGGADSTAVRTQKIEARICSSRVEESTVSRYVYISRESYTDDLKYS